MSVRLKVQKIIDGDTFKVHRRIGGSQYITIASIDATEKGERGYMSAKIRLNVFLQAANSEKTCGGKT